MSTPKGFSEHMEHAAHSGHVDHNEQQEHEDHAGQHEHTKEHQHEVSGAKHKKHGKHEGGLGKKIGITMACFGVLLAFCGALVGEQQSELLTTLLAQTNASMQSQTVSTKYRTMVAQLTQLDALSPDTNQFAYQLECTLEE